jgi:hypothetical protein
MSVEDVGRRLLGSVKTGTFDEVRDGQGQQPPNMSIITNSSLDPETCKGD